MNKIVLIMIATFFTLSSSLQAASMCDNLPQTTDLVKIGSKNVLLVGEQITVGDRAPDFKVVDDKFQPVSLNDYKNKTILLSVVPSLDTGVCSLQTKRFNDEIAQFSDDVVMLTVSTDLPFAQKRFCKVENVDKIKVVSDAVWRDFGSNYGVLIEDMGLLARAIFIINQDGTVAYREIVSELANHPDYEQALTQLKKLTTDKI